MLVVGELDDPFLPLPDELLVNLADSRGLLEAALDGLANAFPPHHGSSFSCTGPALQVGAAVLGAQDCPAGGQGCRSAGAHAVGEHGCLQYAAVGGKLLQSLPRPLAITAPTTVPALYPHPPSLATGRIPGDGPRWRQAAALPARGAQLGGGGGQAA